CEGDERNTSCHATLLARQRGRYCGNQSSRKWREESCDKVAALPQSPPAQAKPQQPGAKPKAQRREEGFVMHRGLRHALRRQYNLVAGPRDRPKDDCAHGKGGKVGI